MSISKTVIGLAPLAMSASLLNENLKEVKKKKHTTKGIVGLGMKNIIGVSLIKAEADLIGGL